ncbi:MAG: NUDIX hydrolase [Deltaproteobacteria bacterium]|nr:NUDIX hydrolase [Deltaproteobacteria bacterium]
MDKNKGASIIFVNDAEQVLLFLRDDDPGIPYPNLWDVPGGHVEEGETPQERIVREMKEEMGLDLEAFALFTVREFQDRIEYTYWKKADLDIENITLTEGQGLRWFTAEEAASTRLACGFNEIVGDFFGKAPFRDMGED